MQNLRCVLIATVRGARGSCVLLLIGLTTPSCADVTGRQHHFHPPGWATAPMKTLDDSSRPLVWPAWTLNAHDLLTGLADTVRNRARRLPVGKYPTSR